MNPSLVSKFIPELGDFHMWYANFKVHMILHGNSMSDRQKCNYLLQFLDDGIQTLLQDKAIKPLANLTWRQLENLLIDVLKYPYATVPSRFKTVSLHQSLSESIDDWMTNVKWKTSECEFDKMTFNEFQVLIFTAGLQNDGLKKKLFSIIQNRHLTLDEAYLISREYMAREEFNNYLFYESAPLPITSNSMSSCSSSNKRKPKSRRRFRFKKNFQRSAPPYPCLHCGSMHFMKHCNYRGHICSDCSQIGHKEGYCKTGKNIKSEINK